MNRIQFRFTITRISFSIEFFSLIFSNLERASINNMQKSNARGRAYTTSEDVILCRSWISITQDPLIGNDQSGSQFWERVHISFATLLGTPTDRTSGSLSSRFSIISKEVALFIGKYANIVNRAASGTNDADKVRILI